MKLRVADPAQASTSNELLTRAEQAFGAEEKARGAIFTRSAIVDFMLDLIGYTSNQQLQDLRLLEPSFGGGRFVLRSVDRLLMSWRRHGGENPLDLRDALRAVELDTDTYESFKVTLSQHLVGHGLTKSEAQLLVDAWLVHGDYLLTSDLGTFDFIIGNPPYVRQELIPKDLLQIYRSTYKTMVGRSDLYIPFMEKSLDILSQNGKLSFICADAWTRNDYGKGIREKISQDYALTHYVDMYGLDAFEVQVGAYPSITVIARGEGDGTRVVHADSIHEGYLSSLASDLLALNDPERQEIHTLKAVRGSDPWLLSGSPSVAVIEQLEDHFPTLVEAGCRVGIGVATGADKVYIGDLDQLDVEDDRKLPLATNKDVVDGTLKWSGKGVINPWRDEGGLVDLADYPRLAAYLGEFRERLGKRHTAKSDVERKWYKTIDRITPGLAYEPKLLIPDIKGNGSAITYDPGSLYPHHNLYFITSGSWDLRALQALLRSGIAHLFVAAYSVKIGGGYLRFQAQNLKRIRIPLWGDITPEDQKTMRKAGEAGEMLEVSLLERIYQLESGTLDFLKEQ